MTRRFFLVAVALASCSKSGEHPHRYVNGSGATLPYPLYAKWSSEYARVDGKVRINYQPTGSGAGIRQMNDGVVDFGATDEPLSDAELARAPRPLVHVPTTIGAVVLVHHVSGVSDMKLTPGLVADVFLGVVTRWNDARIRALNPSAPLPSSPITVVHRADGSGTSAALTRFLANSSPAFQAQVGAGTVPRFPVGIGAKGNDGVTELVKSTPDAIGYVELAYAKGAGLPMALVMNRRGRYVEPTLDALDRAARSALTRVPGDPRVSIVDADDEAAYPIAALSLVLVPREGESRAKSEALAKFLWWAVHEGQRFAPDAGYAPLPPELVARAEKSLRELRAEGNPVLAAAGGL